jgi:hypothetical protein
VGALLSTLTGPFALIKPEYSFELKKNDRDKNVPAVPTHDLSQSRTGTAHIILQPNMKLLRARWYLP